MGHDLISNEKKARILELAIKALDGEILSEESKELEGYISSSKQLAAYYSACIKMHLSMVELEASYRLSREKVDMVLDRDFWQMLAVHEQTSPEIETPQEQIQRELVQKVVYPVREKRKMSKFSIVFLAMNAAAILFFVLFLKFAPPKGGIEVATLTDSINAKWTDTGFPMQNGTRLCNDKTLFMLREGLAELKFDNNVFVTIEGPAEFQILDGDMMKLNYGQLYSQVPAEAYGFQICTTHARIIDLGTEFGIKEGLDGDTEVHVLKGKVNLISNILGKKINLNLLAGSARELDAQTGEVKEIPCEDKSFVRQINSNANVIWKGQDTIPLTNLLAGTLFDEVPGGIEINPVNGEYVKHEDYVGGVDRQGEVKYHITDSPFVDGTFIPLGQLPQTISSTGLTWQSPKTNGSLYYNLSDQKKIHDLSTGSFYSLSLTPAYHEKTSLLMHPNMGVTLDLDKIRQEIPTLDIRGFRADAGISSAAKETLEKLYPDGNIPEKDSPNMDFTILLDGKVCKSLTGVGLESGVDKINVEIHPTDRFLTLVSTDGDQHYEYDWFVLADPVLVLK